MPSGFSIRYRLPLITCGLLLVVILSYATAAYRQVEETAMEAAGTRVSDVAGDLADVLGMAAAGLMEEALTVARDSAVMAHLQEPSLAGADAARAALVPEGAGGNLVAVELRDSRGRTLVVEGEGPDFESGGDIPAVADRLSSDEPAVAGRVRATSAGVVVPVVARVSVPDGPAGYVVHWYRMVESAAARQRIEGLIGSDARLYLGDTDGNVWTDLVAPAPGPPVAINAGPEVLEYTRPEEGPQVASAKAVPNAPWTVLVELPRAAAVAPAIEMLPWLVLFGAVLLLLGAATAWLLSRDITGSLAELADAAGAISSGNYGRRVTLTRSDELGTLAKGFNTMGAAVEKAHETLESKVAQLARMEASHREVRERLDHVITSSPSVIYARPTQGDHTSLSWISENVERILGYEPSEALAPGWWAAHLHPEDRELLAVDTIPEFSALDGVREYRFQTAAGEVRWMRDEQRIVRDRSGEPVEVVGALSDITERRQLEEQFRRSQKMEAVGRLAGGVAHDFNNLLTVILGEAEMALAEGASEISEPTKEALAEVRSAGEKASRLTRQLLAFSSTTVVETTAFRPNELVQEVHKMLRRLIGEDISLELRTSDDVGTVDADRGQIEQVLVNLVVNARDATPPGGRVVIETANTELDEEYAARHGHITAGEYVVLLVSDTGEGMTTDVQSHLFEPFFTTKPAGKGTGLGLATCYAIVRRFGGHIGVYSEVGVGTTMKVYLPRSMKEPSVEVAGSREAPAGGTERILVVEDDEQVRAITVRILRRQGYEVVEAQDGLEAVSVLEDEAVEIDLLLTDVVMPRMGGRELASRARALRPELRIIFASGYSDEVVIQNRVLEVGMSMVQKPFTRDLLTRRVREALDRPVTWA